MIEELEGFSENKRSKISLLWVNLKFHLKDTWYLFLSIPSFIKRLIAYLPIIWNDRDYDYSYLLQLLEFKISRMNKSNTVSSQHEVKEYVSAQMNEAQILLNRIIDNVYDTKVYKEMTEKYGNCVFLTKPVEGESGFKELCFTRSKCLNDPALFQEEKDASLEAYDKANKEREKDFKRLWQLLDKHVEGWWH